MTGFIVFVVLVAALGLAAYLGWLPDSRDPEFGLGPIIDGPLRTSGR